MADALRAAAVLAEFFGTFMVTFSVACNQLANTPGMWAPTINAGVLMVMLYATVASSGGHLNPAVTIASALASKMRGRTAAIYVVAQLLAGLTGSTCASICYQDKLQPFAPRGHFHLWQALVVETLYTALMALVLLSVTPRRLGVYGLSGGLVLVAGSFASARISGGALNPAVVLAINLPNGDMPATSAGIIYATYHFVGSAIAAVLLHILRPDATSEPNKDQPLVATKLAVEFLGTLCLVLTFGLCSLAVAPSLLPWPVAACLVSLMLAFGDVSGGYFNPATTLAATAGGGMQLLQAFFYLLVQVKAGGLGGLLFTGLNGNKSFPLGPTAPHPLPEALACEACFSFLLCLAFLSLAPTDAGTAGQGLQRLGPRSVVVGGCLAAGIALGSHVSGGIINPAVSAGVSAGYVLQGGDYVQAGYYCGAQACGAILAACAAQLTKGKEPVQKADRPLILGH